MAGPADPEAAGVFFAASRKAFAWSNSYPDSAETAIRFLNPLRIECGADAYVEYPIPNENDAYNLIAFWNLERMVSSVKLRTAASKIAPS